MSSTPPKNGPVHPEVSADAGAEELVELSDDEVERQLLEAGVSLGPMEDPVAESDATRPVEESGAWVAYKLPARSHPPARPAGPAPAGSTTEARDAKDASDKTST